jgi:predicted amidohydrolase YtcJ
VAESWVIRDVVIGEATELTDCRIANGRVAEIGAALPVGHAEQVLRAHGGSLLPGLSDHHAHLWASVAAADSIDLAGTSDLVGAVQLAERKAARGVLVGGRTGESRWLRVIGAGAEFSRADLDEHWPDSPVRVQHRSGALWTLNSVAVASLSESRRPAASDAHPVGLTDLERETGQLWRADDRLRELLAESSGAEGESGQLVAAADGLRRVGAEFARWGVTHLTDASPETTAASLERLRSLLPQRVMSLGPAGDGPRKLIVADHDLPGLDELTDQIAGQHAAGRAVAVHAVSAVGLALLIAAFDQAGVRPGDRVEHAAVCHPDAADRLAEFELTVVTQPGVFARNGARFSAESPPDERSSLWRYGSLLRAGVPVAISSDAPYGPANPWRNVVSASKRAGEEAVSSTTALASLLTEPTDPAGSLRQVRVGAPADLCLLGAPLITALSEVSESMEAGETEHSPVLATFIDGTLCYLAGGYRTDESQASGQVGRGRA